MLKEWIVKRLENTYVAPWALRPHHKLLSHITDIEPFLDRMPTPMSLQTMS